MLHYFQRHEQQMQSNFCEKDLNEAEGNAGNGTAVILQAISNQFNNFKHVTIVIV
jgi:hypothetical protein